MKILLVEDERLPGMMLSSTLQSLGHEVALADNAQIGFEMLDQDNFRMIISDWRMPGVDGMGFCRMVRERTGEYTYFILITAQAATKEFRKAAYASGVDDFLRKPVDPDEISMRIHVANRIIGLSDKVTRIEGFVPVCRSCHTSRNDSQFWQEVEALVRRHRVDGGELDLCPACIAFAATGRDTSKSLTHFPFYPDR